MEQNSQVDIEVIGGDLKRQKPPTEPDKLADKWEKTIAKRKKEMAWYVTRCKHNRELVQSRDESAPDSKDFNPLRANLIQGSIGALVPVVYANNPEIDVREKFPQLGSNRKLLCETMRKVINVSFERALLKEKAEDALRQAMTCSLGIFKVTFQNDLREDPIIRNRMNDVQDNILRLESLAVDGDDEACSDQEAKKLELKIMLQALEKDLEVVVAKGMVIDLVDPENLILDSSVKNFSEYRQARWMTELIPMTREEVQERFKMEVTGSVSEYHQPSNRKQQSAIGSEGKEDASGSLLIVQEIWDKVTNTVYTKLEGASYWLRDPYQVEAVGERWYPYFILPFDKVSGSLYAPSMVDLTEKLQAEHNSARDQFNRHREICIPASVMDAANGIDTITRMKDRTLGEIVLVDTGGKPIRDVLAPIGYPAIDPLVYDTNGVRVDWEQVTGLQDAARSTITKPKTATEAKIMDNAMSGRVSKFRDMTEDFLSELSRYVGQMLLMELDSSDVARMLGTSLDQAGQNFDWPQVADREEIYNMIYVSIRAGTTGAPNKLEEQENWGRILPIIQGLVMQILDLESKNIDASPLREMLKKTILMYDDSLDVSMYLPPERTQIPAMAGLGMQGQLPQQQIGAM